MITKVHMEALSPTMEEGQLVNWLKSEGDDVTNGDVLAEIETDKATMELVARGDGVLRKILLDEGGTAPVGEVIAVIADAEEDISEVEGGGGGGKPDDAEVDHADEAENEAADEDEDEDEAGGDDAGSEAKQSAETSGGGGYGAREADQETPDADTRDRERIKASPLARRLADDFGVDLASVEGSGPGGRIVKRDVEEAKEAGTSAPAPTAPSGDEWSPDEEEYEDVAISQMRKTIAKRLVESIGPVPHFFLTVEVDMGRVMQARKTVNAMLEEEGRKVSINDFVLKATAGALRRHPNCNAHWLGTDRGIRRFNPVHLGVAVAVEDGLITPVVRHAHRKGIARISEEVREMAGRAREKKLKPEEYTGATFSVSNLGMFGIEEFTAVINPPEAGILAVGGIEEVPVVEDGEVVVRPRMKVTMSCDHRVIDGAQGARFLQTLKGMLEEPAAILV